MLRKKQLTVIVFVCLSTFLLSWSLSEKKAAAISDLPDADNTSIFYENDFDRSLPRKPAAQDVLVQKIKGDDNHLLLMAYYAKESYAANTLTLENAGEQLLLRDDGAGDDAQAGDNFYTVKIDADVKSFQQLALQLTAQQNKSAAKRFHFENRALVYDADAPEGFDMDKLNSYQPVSVAGLNSITDPVTNALRSNSLFITRTSVVEDPLRTWNPCTQKGTLYGAWTFQKLMRELATTSQGHPPTDAELSSFVLAWLDNFNKTQIINSDTVLSRPLVAYVFTNPWLNKSFANGAPKGQLDMRFAPVKLLAIVNRFDQRGSFAGEPAGEARFLFTMIMSDCSDSKDYTMAIEYTINKPNQCDSLQSWANQWYNLKDLTLGSAAYNNALQKITDQFALFGTNKNNINQSCFKSLRTNDQALTSGKDTLTGEFREFIMSPTKRTLVMTTVTNAPAERYNMKVNNVYSRLFADYVNKNTKSIITNPFTTMPVSYKDSPFLGGKAKIIGEIPVGAPQGTDPYHLDGTEPNKASGAYITNNNARHIVSLNACNGCHAGETQTNFWHVDPTFFGKEAKISGFLSGKLDASKTPNRPPVDWDNNNNNDSMVVMDPALRPAGNPQMYIYNDILRRAIDLQDFVNYQCGSVLKVRDQLMFKPLNMVH